MAVKRQFIAPPGTATNFRIATHDNIETALLNVLGDLRILSGDVMGPSDASWQDVAGTCATNCEVMAMLLHAARRGNHEAFLTFPSPAEALEKLETLD